MATNQDPDYDAVADIIVSDTRVEIVDVLADGPAMPSVIADRAGIASSTVSTELSELRDHGIVELLVDEDRKRGRIYGLTDEGEDAADTLGDVQR